VKPRSRGFIAVLGSRILGPWNGSTGAIDMFNRRSLMVGGLAMATAPSLTGIAQAQSGQPMLVFVGHEL
jgi:hypothetical protein